MTALVRYAADSPDAAAHREALAGLLVDSVAGGASVGFLDPLGLAAARQWWEAELPEGVTLLALEGGRVVGCVRLVPAHLPNSAHRAEISKLLVHSDARGRGLASALLSAAEDEARRLGRMLLILDTQTGSDAEHLYRRRGWTEVGRIPDYAGAPDGSLVATTIFCKQLT
jgi:GNAT superfamily N-acetyltransferase